MNSPMFGETREPTDEEEEFLLKMQDECPVRMFQMVNKALNEKGFCCSIQPLNP